MPSSTKPSERLYFDWREFLDARGIRYTAHEGRGWAALACPFCGDLDRGGDNLGVRLDPEEPGWSCWRDYEHRGRHPERLVQALLGCSLTEARGIVENARRAAADPLENQLFLQQELDTRPFSAPPLTLPTPLAWPAEIRPLAPGPLAARPFAQYLERRGFPDWAAVAAAHGLRYAISGPFGWRLMFPAYGADGRLASWTGRSIKTGVEPRYRSLSHRPYPDQPLATAPISDLIYNQPSLAAGGRVLAVCEGPFDALKVDWYGAPAGLRATCLFGKLPSPAQVAALAQLAPAYSYVMLLLDRDATADTWALREELQSLCRTAVYLGKLPAGAKDPGDLTREQVLELAK